MATAIIITGISIPAIIEYDTFDALFERVKKLETAPLDLNTVEDVRFWLSKLPRPSGLYATRHQALEATRVAAKARNIDPVSADLIKDTRHKMGLSRVKFGRRLGFNGNDGTVNKAVQELERGRTQLRGEKILVIQALRAEQEILTGDNNEIIDTSATGAPVKTKLRSTKPISSKNTASTCDA